MIWIAILILPRSSFETRQPEGCANPRSEPARAEPKKWENQMRRVAFRSRMSGGGSFAVPALDRSVRMDAPLVGIEVEFSMACAAYEAAVSEWPVSAETDSAQAQSSSGFAGPGSVGAGAEL
jgi:hypothetical protein